MEKDFFTIPNLPELESFMDRHCITDPHEDTASLLIFRQGGYIEKFKDGTYHVTLDRSDIYDKDLNVVKRALYNWCDGEEFNYHNGFKFGEYKSENGCTWDLQEFAILSNSYNAWLEKENLPQIKVIETEGTYLVWLDFRELGLEPKELEKFMRGKAKLALDEGYIFGQGGEGFERINIACPKSILEQALNRIKEAIINMKIEKEEND